MPWAAVIEARAGNIWDSYAGSSSVFVGYSGYADVLHNDTFPGSPKLSVQLTALSGGGSTLSIAGALMDTGSTGIVIDLASACQTLIHCTGSSKYNYAPDPSTAIIGYGSIKYTSSTVGYDGFYVNIEVKVLNPSGTAMSVSQVPVFIATKDTEKTQAEAPVGQVRMFGVGFGRGNAAGVQLKDANGNLNGVTLYGNMLNPLLNLTQLNLGSGLTSNISSIAPGYVVTSQGVFLGLSPSVLNGHGTFVSLMPYGQTGSGSNVSTYATAATASDWRTPPMLMQISNNTPGAGGASINGTYYGTMLVDTGINNAILTPGGNTRINPALLHSVTPTYIRIGLPGAVTSSGDQPSQYTYVFQGVCRLPTSDNVGCGPSPMWAYNGGQASLMVPVYPTSSVDSHNGGVNGQNTGFAGSTSETPYLNTGVNFLNYFDVVYDPVSGAIGYQPNGTAAGVPPELLSVSPMLALQGSFSIPDRTDIGTPLFLFTDIANQTNPVYAPVDVVLSAASPSGVVTVSQPITSDFIVGCTLANCSTGVVINQGTFIFNAANNYTGLTTINPSATLALGPNGSIANSFGVVANGTFDISATNAGASITSLSGAGMVELGGKLLTLTNASGTFTGTIADGGLGGSLRVAGGVQTLAGVSTYSGPTTVDGGKLIVNGSIVDSITTVNAGGTIGGNGLLGKTVINGGTISPGNSIGTITIKDNLSMAPGSTYLAEVSPSSADRVNVAGTAALAGAIQAMFQTGTYFGRNYTLLSATGGRSSAFDTLMTFNLPVGLSADLSYTPTDVVLTLTAVLGRNTTLKQNQRAIADAVDAFFNSGGVLPAGIHSLFNLSGSNLGGALSQLSGEPALGGQQVSFQMTNQFLSLMLDPFIEGRSALASPNATALGFAAERETARNKFAAAYAAVPMPVKATPSFEKRWGQWASAYGGSSRTSGESTVTGSHDVSARVTGFAGGLDYRLTGDSTIGFALAGGGTSWSVSQGLGGGHSDAFQIGVYGITRSGPAYLAATLSYTHHWMSTDRTALAGDQVTASFNANSFGGRLEAGYRMDAAIGGVTPYAALQMQRFHTPRYSESDSNGGGFALTYEARTSTNTRSELGARFDHLTALDSSTMLALRGRLAWAHDWFSDPAVTATFQTLPGASFIVNGATPPTNSLLASAGAEVRLTNGISLHGRLDTEFADNASTYTGTGTVRYTW